jgi:hypothetical protein
LLFRAFALRPGPFFAQGAFALRFDTHSFFKQASGAVRRDLDGPRRAAT